MSLVIPQLAIPKAACSASIDFARAMFWISGPKEILSKVDHVEYFFQEGGSNLPK